MITVEQATQIIFENTGSFGEETVPLAFARGRVLREDLSADRDFPPFDRVSMDGIAICFEAFAAGRRDFFIEGMQAAGTPQLVLSQTNNSLEVMTGAILPKNTDAVIRYEDVEIRDGFATVLIENVQYRQNIHGQGTDRRQGEVVVRAGCLISPAEIGVSATVGKVNLRVAVQPKIAVISTGDELVDIDQTPLPHQIRKSNVHTLAAMLAGFGIEADLFHLMDDRAAIESTLDECMKKYDAILLSGGVSMGKFDFVPEVLAELGVQKLFHKVAQRPGKPFWFGRGKRTVVFALPGNPVSSFMCAHRYFLPWLRACLGFQPFENQYAVLAEDFFFKPDLTYFLQVKLKWREDGVVEAWPVEGHGSGDLANLTAADAFLELPAGRQDFRRGETFPLFIYR